MIITLLGYMGCGKSTVGKELASLMHYNFIDLDAYIEAKEGLTVSAIFEKKGEIYFRKKEIECLKKILTLNTKVVLSIGGGTPCYATNMELINKYSKSFYLKVSVQELNNRLFKEKESRPLISHIAKEEDLKEFIGMHLFERSFFYSKANETISIENNSIAQVVKKIVAKLY